MKKEKKAPKQQKPEKPGRRFPNWIWPLGLAATGVATAATILLRGCWHTKMSWPMRVTVEPGLEHAEDFSYQVCTQCGIKRLFDDQAFLPYGPYGYELKELVARERAARERRRRRQQEASDRKTKLQNNTENR